MSTCVVVGGRIRWQVCTVETEMVWSVRVRLRDRVRVRLTLRLKMLDNERVRS